MNEQDLTALAKRHPFPSLTMSTAERERYELAQGYLSLLAERDALKAQIQTVIANATKVVDENHELTVQLKEASRGEILPACPQCGAKP